MDEENRFENDVKMYGTQTVHHSRSQFVTV